TAVVQRARWRQIREGFGRNEVLHPHVGGVHVQLASQAVHHPLEPEVWLDAAVSPVGRDGHLVREYCVAFEAQSLDGVRPEDGRQRARPARLVDGDVRALVVNDAHLHAEDRAVALRGELNRLDTPHAVMARGEMLQAILDPLDRPTDLARQDSDQYCPLVHPGLDAEAAAYIGHDEAEVRLPNAQAARGDLIASEVANV